MMSPQKHSLSPRRRSRAFSLVLSLTVMAMLLILCIGAAALLSIELRVANASVSMAKARLNALVAARIAIGTLQAQAGPDTRVTAPSTLLAANPTAGGNISNGVTLPRLTGVWKGQSVNSNYASAHDAAFLAWLVSGTTGQQGTSALLNYPRTATLNSGNAVHLLSAPASKPGSDSGLADNDPVDVYAVPETITDSAGNTMGRIAWWISDENQKANMSLRLKTPTSVADMLESARNSTRYGLKFAGDGNFANFPETLAFNPAILNRESMAFDNTSVANPWLTDNRNYYHSVTPYSESLLTDVVNGGLKYDLSLMLGMGSLPNGYVGDSGYVGFESVTGSSNPYAAAKGGWLKTGVAASLTPGSLPSVNQLEWTCWGDVWNYARIYKHPSFDAGSGMLMNSAADANGTSSNSTLDMNGNVSDVQNLSAWREPVVIQMQVMVGVQTIATTDPTKLNINIVQRPYIQLWNPYNVPLKFTNKAADSILGRFISLPGRLTINVGSTSYALDEWASLSSQSSGFNVFQLYLNYLNQPPLAPGEVRVFSPAGSTIVVGNSSSAVVLSSGLRPFGGFGTILKWPPTSYTTTTVTCSPTDVITASIQTPVKGWYATSPASYTVNQWARAAYSSLTQTTATAAGRGWSVAYATGEQLLKFDTASVSSTGALLTAGTPRFFGLLTMRLRSEAASVLRTPAFAYGDPLRWIYNPVAATSYSANQDVWLSPYEFTQSHISSDTDSGPQTNPVMQSDSQNRGYAFTDYTPTFGVSKMVFSHLPLAPLGSLGDLRDARLGGGVSYTRRTGANAASPANKSMPRGYSVVPNAFGNSYMHPMVSQTGLTGNSGTFANENFYDFSWIMNSALWDSYFMSGITDYDSPVSSLNGTVRTLDSVARDFFINSKSLPNRRLLLSDYGIGPQAMLQQLVSGTTPAPDGYAKTAASMGVDGGFNINSTSVRAWRALLSGLNGGSLPTLADSVGIAASSQSPSTGSPVLRSTVQNGPLADANTGSYSLDFNQKRTVAGRVLSSDQLTSLAQQIVLQVKKRGPFLSMGEFMNRRIESSEYGIEGALQTAIDASGINAFATSSSVNKVDAGAVSSLFPTNPTAMTGTGAGGSGSLARGMPGFISQADVIAPVASMITPRSDTFTIRVSGSSEDGATAYMELVVQRTPSFVNTADAPYIVPSQLTQPTNKAFGRRFVLVSSRWMQSADI